MARKYTKQDDAGTIPARKRDLLIVKIVDWSDDKPDNCRAFDVEVYVNGVFDPDRSIVYEYGRGEMTKKQALACAIEKAKNEVWVQE